MNSNDDETAGEPQVTRANIDMTSDIHDSPEDEKKMATESVVIDLPEVSDIPGQENIVVPQIGEMADTTISSDDEEGLGIFGDDDADEDTDLIMGNDADVSPEEKTLLQQSEDMPAEDDNKLQEAQLDSTDNEGEPLNEGGLADSVSGADIDTGGTDEDDAMEATGEEDEENNTYSVGGDSNDDVTEGTT